VDASNSFRLHNWLGQWFAALGEGKNRRQNGRRGLVAEACADGYALAANGAAAAENGCAGLGLHARAETVCLHALAAIGLKCALGHGYALLFPSSICVNLHLDGKD
jgi:hypothetical protein